MSLKIAIGVPIINRSKLLLRAMRSVLEQTYSNIELLTSDDTSTDDTLDRIVEIEDPRVVLYQQQKRLGLVVNVYFCFSRATGELFLLLGDGDMLLPRAIERLVALFLQEKDTGVTWCPCVIAATESSRYWTTDGGPERERLADMLSALWSSKRGPRLSGTVVRTAEAIEVGGYRSVHGDLCDILTRGESGRA